MNNPSRTLSSGSRKYTPVWNKIKTEGECIIKCPVEDSITIVRAVQKEKNRDKNRPKGKTIDYKVIAVGDGQRVQITFSLVSAVVTINDL